LGVLWVAYGLLGVLWEAYGRLGVLWVTHGRFDTLPKLAFFIDYYVCMFVCAQISDVLTNVERMQILAFSNKKKVYRILKIVGGLTI
jgi:hypothetical protein